LILGASGGIGRAVTNTLHAQGAALGLHACRHPDRFAATPDGLRVRGYSADFRVVAEIEALAKTFLADFGRLDAFIWCAGIAKDAPALTQKEADLREVLAVNLTAPALLLKAFSRQFLKQRSGSVVLLSSHAGLSGRAGGASYAMAQSGLIALSKSLAREWGASGVRVNALVPPFVADSEMGRAASPEFIESLKRRGALKTSPQSPPANPAEAVGTFVVQLLENRTASGQVFTLDSRIV
jgi:3-oxoacyl-[acyl-carrier protein] reductase